MVRGKQTIKDFIMNNLFLVSLYIYCFILFI